MNILYEPVMHCIYRVAQKWHTVRLITIKYWPIFKLFSLS